MRAPTLLFCIYFIFAQSNSPAPGQKAQSAASALDQKSKSNDFGLGIGTHGRLSGVVSVVSDEQGVDIEPYLRRVVRKIRQNWLLWTESSQPTEMTKGIVTIEFAITKDGKGAQMRLISHSGDIALNRSAWASISQSNPFPPLPAEFIGTNLALRILFDYDADRGDCPSNSRIVVCINAPTNLEVPVGGAEIVTAFVTGTKEQAVEWIVSGAGCSGSTCGKMSRDVYSAPSVRPNPPEVNLIAVSKADPIAKASVIIHIVEPASEIMSRP